MVTSNLEKDMNYDDYACDEGEDISQFRKGWDKEKIKKIYEKLENEKGRE